LSHPRASKILIVKLGSLGDIIHALPAAAAIRRAFPHSEIDWLADAVIASSSISCRSSAAGL
jgi:heptosyltransferase-1